MFTGIITHMGTVAAIDDTKGDIQFSIQSTLGLTAADLGASIACSGCCLTVTGVKGDIFTVDVSAETLSKTNLGTWKQDTKINLEKSLKLGDEMGGHIVSGHVDGLAEIVSITPEGGSHRLKIRAPEGLAGMVAPKGSVALDGISLTVNEVEGDIFGINIIPHTWQVTTLGQRSVGDKLNMEVDMLARYVARLIDFRG